MGPSPDLVARFRRDLEALDAKPERIGVAVSGGPDSLALLLLANYQEDPRGERAADSLYFLGQSLMALKKPADACKVYAELQDVYGTTLRDFLRQRLPEARAAAKCE